MTELTIEERLDRLERYAQVACRRCGEVIPFYRASAVLRPSGSGEFILCPNCKHGYDDLIDAKETETKSSLLSYIKEVKRERDSLGKSL